MRRGGFGKEGSDQPEQQGVKITPIVRVLHPMTRVVIGLAIAAGGVWTLFTWDWRYFAASLWVLIGGLIVGPWVNPVLSYITSDANPDEDGVGNPW